MTGPGQGGELCQVFDTAAPLPLAGGPVALRFPSDVCGNAGKEIIMTYKLNGKISS